MPLHVAYWREEDEEDIKPWFASFNKTNLEARVSAHTAKPSFTIDHVYVPLATECVLDKTCIFDMQNKMFTCLFPSLYNRRIVTNWFSN